MKLMIIILMLAFCATSAMAVQTLTYGWEDGVGIHLGTNGNVGEAVNVDNFAHTGTHSLYMTEDPLGGTPQVYVAWIAALQDGDEVTVSFWSYDDTPDGYPRSRIWAHYTSNAILDHQGSASGNNEYTPGTGWSEQSWTWTVDLASDPDRTALCIEFRMYSADGLVGPYYCDDVTVTAPDEAQIFFPDDDPVVANEETTFGGVKALYR